MFNKCVKSAANGHTGEDKLLWGVVGATGPGWLVYKKNSRGQNTVYP